MLRIQPVAAYVATAACALVLTLAAAEPGDVRYDEAYRTYDTSAAADLMADLEQSAHETPGADHPAVYAKACLLAAELYRIQFEETPKKELDERRRLGALIDRAANRGLAAIDNLDESAETWRLRGDLLATRIRTKFQAKKFRKKMDAAIAQARALEPEDPMPILSAAKPLLFAPERHGGDLEQALGLLEQALALDPRNDRAWVLKGIALRELGDPSAAREAWERALDINPACTPAQHRLDGLDEAK